MTNKCLLDQISDKIGELSVEAVLAKHNGDTELENACKEAIMKLMDAREKIMEEANEKKN